MKDFLDIHADDYGLSVNSDKTILELLETNKLDSISFMTNLSHFNNAVSALKSIQTTRKNPALVSVHLNFVEGHCCAPKESVPDLIDKNGYFSITWEKLFLWNYMPFKRNSIKRQLTSEIIAQTERLINSEIVSASSLRFDSHMHTHMIPLVFDALQNAIKKQDYTVEFIRNTEDPIKYYLGFPKLYKSYSPVNAIKCIILNFYSLFKVRPALRKMGQMPEILCGVFFSGKMDKDRLKKVLPVFKKKALSKKCKAEILFHPCLMKKEELTAEFNKVPINKFHISENRVIEYKTCKELTLS